MLNTLPKYSCYLIRICCMHVKCLNFFYFCFSLPVFALFSLRQRHFFCALILNGGEFYRPKNIERSKRGGGEEAEYRGMRRML